MAGEHNLRLGIAVHAERVAQSLYHGLCAEIAAADAYHHDNIAFAAQTPGGSVYVVKKAVGCVFGQTHPAEEIVAGAGALQKSVDTATHLGSHGFNGILAHCAEGVVDIHANIVHDYISELFLVCKSNQIRRERKIFSFVSH